MTQYGNYDYTSAVYRSTDQLEYHILLIALAFKGCYDAPAELATEYEALAKRAGELNEQAMPYFIQAERDAIHALRKP